MLGRRAPVARRGLSWAHDHFGTDSLQVLELAEALDEPPVVIYWGFDASLTDEAVSAHPELAKYVQRLSEVFVTAAAIVAVSRFIAAELVRQVPEAKLRVHCLLYTSPSPRD